MENKTLSLEYICTHLGEENAALLYGLKANTHLICVMNAYGPARTFIDHNLKKWGVEATYIQGTDIKEFEQAIRPNTSMIYLESPTSVVMQLQDLKAVAALAKKHGIVTAIDNTWSAGVYQKPLTAGTCPETVKWK